jgi:hypothetical protein
MKRTQLTTWIDVNDALPTEIGQKVLCVQDPTKTATELPLLGIFNGKHFLCPQPTIYANFEVGIGRWADVIYWIPLPKTPKQLSDEKTL